MVWVKGEPGRQQRLNSEEVGHLTTFSFLAGFNLRGGSKYRYSMLAEGKLNALLPGTVRTSLTIVIKLLSVSPSRL